MGVNSRPSDYPVVPVLTGVLAEEVAADAAEAGRRPLAYPTFARYSDAGRCGRAMAYSYLERTFGVDVAANPRDDPAGHFVMWHGTLMHEMVMGAIVKRYGGRAEAPSELGVCSGSADLVVELDGKRTLYELKTIGAFGFDKAVGIVRKGWTSSHPEGPRRSALIQGALNALAHDCETLVIGYVAMEAVSVGLAQKLNMANLDRIVAEWHYERAEWEPWAHWELARMRDCEAQVQMGVMPERQMVGQEGQIERCDPTRPTWSCSYCPYLDICRKEP